MKPYSRIIGTGSYLPPARLSNADMVARLAQEGIETSDEWIVERTGIRARHFAAAGVSSSDLGAEAARTAVLLLQWVRDTVQRVAENYER